MQIGTFTTFTYVIHVPTWVNFATLGAVSLTVVAAIVWMVLRGRR